MRRFLLVAAAVVAQVAASPACAGLFDDDEARARVEALRAEVAEVSKRIDAAARTHLDVANQFEALRSELAKLRGQLEVLTIELDASQKRQKDFYVDLDNRLRKLEAPAPAAKAEAKGDPAAETKEYEDALSALKASKFKEAAGGFLAFIGAWPNSSLLPSAYYWGGYAHAQMKDHRKAAEMFAKFVATWPADERAPSAMESQAYNLEVVGDVKGARFVLLKLSEAYPNSDAGKRAAQRLKRK